MAPLLLLAALLAACATGSPPVGDRDPVLAIGYIGQQSAVAVFDTPGPTAELRRASLLQMPEGLLSYSSVFGPSGDLFVATSVGGAIVIVDAAVASGGGDPTRPTVVAGRSFTSPDMLNPVALAFDARGDLWVADGRNTAPESPGPNRLLRFAAPTSIQDGASVAAATVLDLAAQPTGYRGHWYLYALHIDAQDRLWYVDHFGWSVGRIDDLSGRGAHEVDVVPDLQFVNWAPEVGDAAVVNYPVGIAVSDAGAVYLGSRDGAHVYRFDGAGSRTGFLPGVPPDALLEVGVDKPRFVALDDEGALWALSNTSRTLVRVEDHAEVTGTVSLSPTRRLEWAPEGQVLGGGMSFSRPPR